MAVAAEHGYALSWRRTDQLANYSVSRLAPILEKLARAQSRMLGTADEVPADQWRTKPKGGGWCAAEIVAHLIMVERSVVGSADRVVQHAPRRFSRLQRLHLPLALVEARIVKRQAPVPVDPEMLGEKETMLAELRNIRERVLAFLEETKERNLAVYRWPHPFLGSLSAYEWFEMVARHELRHEKQMREIAAGYRKP
jgi:DinB superfamily